MKAHLVHVDTLRFRARAEEAPEVLFDAGDREDRQGPSPVQGALLSVMACTAADIVLILQKQRVPFTSLEIEADAERATEDPGSSRRFGCITRSAETASRIRRSRERLTCHRRNIVRSESCSAARAWSLSTRTKSSRWSDVFSGHALVPGMFK